MATGKMLLSHLKSFTEATSIHGIFHIFQPKSERQIRLAWSVLFICMLGLTLYNCSQNVNDYLKYSISTKTTNEYMKDFDFPAITFCSQYFIKRSEIGNLSVLNLLLATLLATNEEEQNFLLNQGSRVCNSNYRSNTVKAFEQISVAGWLKFINDNAGIMEIFKATVTDFRKDVRKCCWNGLEIDCRSVLVNMMQDVQYCFTFNIGNVMIKNFIDMVGGSGLNKTNYDEKQYKVKNSKTSKFQMLINTNESENCGALSIKRGTGYFMMITQKNEIPSTLINKPIYLTSGYVNEISLKPTYYRRYTEHLGKCVSKVKWWFVNYENYMPEVCWVECIGIQIIQHCKCYSPNLAQFHEMILNHSEELKIPKSSVQKCGSTGMLCIRKFVERQLSTSPIDFCTYCKTPCYEEKYAYTLTTSLITRKLLENDLPSTLLRANPDIKSFRKNFAYVSIGYADSNVNLVEETQAITLRDLYIFIGGNIGLFLGMSFMSIFEIAVELFLHSIVFLLQNVRKRCDLYKEKDRKKTRKRKIRHRKSNVRVTNGQPVASF